MYEYLNSEPAGLPLHFDVQVAYNERITAINTSIHGGGLLIATRFVE